MPGNGKCIVPLCGSRKGKKSCKNISFHEVPAHFDLRRKWIASIEPLMNEDEKSWILSERSVVCSLHFPDTAFKNNATRRILIRGSVPSLFNREVPISPSDVEDEMQEIQPTKKVDAEKGGKAPHLVVLKENVNNQLKTFIPEDTALDDEHSVGNDSICVNFSENSVYSSPSISPCKTRRKAPIKLQSAQRSIRRLKAKIRKIQAESEHLKAENSNLKDKLIRYNINSLEDASEEKYPKAIFLKDQLNALNKRKVNWSDLSMEYAMELYNKFPASYNFLREKVLNLPSRSTIKRCLLRDAKFSEACSVASPVPNFDTPQISSSNASPAPNFSASQISSSDASPVPTFNDSQISSSDNSPTSN
ncbi:THAP domain-containing protein 6-like [Uloborus diversus]|uniref:THAP domain-containing protein 6-like n=1 Tax=Uloborus diversus TaxID=327109 RepID=UPI00240A9444|nr:THAP domain-containing protein 6-like [Uloborus diversus]